MTGRRSRNKGAKLCECGCGQAAPLAPHNNARLGWVKGQALRFVHGHNARKNLDDLIRPMDCTCVEPCWEWLGGTNGSYGRMKWDGRMQQAHRVFYEREHGPIPEGMQLDHLCGTPICVNPAHLEIVTPKENNRRRKTTVLNAELVALIRADYAQLPRGRARVKKGHRAALAEKYGVSVRHLADVVKGEKWADV